MEPAHYSSSKSFRRPPTPPKSEVSEGDVSEISPPTSRKPSSAVTPRYPLPPPTNPPRDILQEDLKTPDNHVPRDSRLIRLTGIHPFNVEAPLSALYDEGFLTSPELFYVRNHGAVPQVDDASIEDWEFSIEGMVRNPVTMTLKQLIAEYEQITVPITLGADKLPNGYYGTSVKLNWAMDPNKGMMLAHKMNGGVLRPDHGKPLRVVIPGQIGGRSVKWLKRIIVSAAPSDNWYHIYDNRVLPTMISPEQSANEPKLWMDERYAIYDLSTNSAIAYPAHDETLSLSNAPETYKVRGYAYGGGGRRVTRVEVTLDKGISWALADIRYHEDDYRDHADEDEILFGGKLDMGWRETCFTWCFWEIDLKVDHLKIAGDIMVRGMDESMSVQPRDMYWSVLGMMNNPWYRVTITNDGIALHFEHPTQPALMPGGWMEKVKARGGNLANGFWGESMGGEEEATVELNKEIKMTRDGLIKNITIDELRKHDGEQNPWFVVNGEVYDGTPFLEEHPGGATSMIGAAGQDASDEFMAIHSENAKEMMQNYHIGSLDKASLAALTHGDEELSSDPSRRPVFLQPKTWTKALLSSKKTISADTRIFNFSLEHADQTIGLPIGQHLMMRLRDPVTREAIIRSYTPISQGSDKGTLQVLIKLYFDTAERAGGKMTKALDAIPVGHFVEFKGPIGKFEYLKKGNCTIGGQSRFVKRFIMICAGSGITPIFQVLRAVLSDAEDETKCLVLDGNRQEADILCREEMDTLVRGQESRCRLLYALTKPEENWQGLVGRISKDLLETEVGKCESTDGEELVLICGPKALEKSVHGFLTEMRWKDEDLFFF
ncbi:nitrate reductase [Diplocarpon rosae]|nr:nitrate reductase [Diplocarpon rosae]